VAAHDAGSRAVGTGGAVLALATDDVCASGEHPPRKAVSKKKLQLATRFDRCRRAGPWKPPTDALSMRCRGTTDDTPNETREIQAHRSKTSRLYRTCAATLQVAMLQMTITARDALRLGVPSLCGRDLSCRVSTLSVLT
jgi:hypothetical protein